MMITAMIIVNERLTPVIQASLVSAVFAAPMLEPRLCAGTGSEWDPCSWIHCRFGGVSAAYRRVTNLLR